MRLERFCDHFITYSFYLLLFLTPLILTPLNYELFEYNKMMFVYALTAIIVGSWGVKMIVNRRFEIRRTPLDIPLALFFISQLLSFTFSLDRHVSFWGYYSRFHGGLLSTFTYLLLYYALATNLDKAKVLTGLRWALLSGAMAALYGVAEHFGIDDQYWVQDVKNRVFSTLGQPNWLAAYLSVLVPIAVAFGLKDKRTEEPKNIFGFSVSQFLSFLVAALFYLALLYTKSRSGFLGFWVGNLFFWAFALFWLRKRISKWVLIVNCTFLILNFLIGTPFEQINRYFSLSALKEKITHISVLPPPVAPVPGGTESGEIRKIVWKGAVEIFKHYPLFGSGVETFAFSYYQFRPPEHNFVSEWDFLYNKAHNEYLNFLATTGAFGLGSYLLLIFWFLGWNFQRISKFKAPNSKQYQNSNIKKQNNKSLENLNFGHLDLFRISNLGFGLLAAYISILVSNFFGFSVVVVALFFFLIPAFSFLLAEEPERAWAISFSKPPSPTKSAKNGKQFNNLTTQQLTTAQWVLITGAVIVVLYILATLSRFWLADVHFARGYNFGRIEQYSEAYNSLKQAIQLNPAEPFYRDELSSTASLLAIELIREQDATGAATLAQEAIRASQKALETSPQNVSFWKTRTRVFYTLSALNEEYNQQALEAIKVAYELAPTDAKVSYNVAILYGRTGKSKEAIETLKETVRLKPDYRDAYYALALYLKTEGKEQEASENLKYILAKISPEDKEAKEMLESWGVKR